LGQYVKTEIFNKRPNNKEDTWEIISKYIQQGLNLNVVPPMMFGGTLVSGVTGTVSALLVFD
jgi:hypothetical protein